MRSPATSFQLVTGARLVLLPLVLGALSGPGVGVAGAGLFGSNYVTIQGPDEASLFWTGEFTGDGRADFLSTGYNGSLWIMASRRAGGFELPRLLESDSDLRILHLADLDGDRLTDLVGRHVQDGIMGVRLARPGGGFQLSVTATSTERYPELAVADFDGDGRAEIALARPDTALVDVYRADESGLTVIRRLQVASNYGQLMALDYTGDGVFDLVVPVDANRLLGFVGGPTLLSAPPDTLRVPSVYLQPEHFASADFDGDGLPDIVFRDGSRTLRLLRQTTPGSWSLQESIPVPGTPSYSSNQLFAGDFDGDGRPDVAGLSDDETRIWILPNDAGQGFRAPELRLVPQRGRAVIAGSWRFGGDELATLSDGGVIAIFGRDPEQSPVRSTALRIPGNTGLTTVVTDFDRDGARDLVIGATTHQETGSLWLALARGDRTFDVTEHPIGFPPEAVAAADFSGDSNTDVIAVSRGRRAVWLFEGDGAGDFRVGRQIHAGGFNDGVSSRTIVAADLDRDGDIDMAMPGPYGQLWTFVNPGDGRFGAPAVTPVQGSISGMALADIDDRPGREIYALSYSPGLIQSFQLMRDGHLAPLRVQNSISRSERQTLSDLNGDCIDDFLLQVGSGDRVTIQYGLGSGRFGEPVFERLGRDLTWATAADLDRDGRDDLMAMSPETGILQVRRGRATGDLGDVEEFSLGGNPFDYLVSDIDGDGWTDLVTLSAAGPEVIINWNGGEEPGESLTPPGRLRLSRISPNPGRGPTQLEIQGTVPGEPIRFEVFDVAGRRLAASSPVAAPTERTCLTWNARDEGGRPVASGHYLVRVTAGADVVDARVTILR